jgi:hypothetical protein
MGELAGGYLLGIASLFIVLICVGLIISIHKAGGDWSKIYDADSMDLEKDNDKDLTPKGEAKTKKDE